MSFTYRFRPFLRVDFDDDDGDPVDVLEVRPTLRSRQLLSAYQLVFRADPTGFSLYYTQNPEAAEPLLTPIGAAVRLAFALVPRRPGFAARYLPDHLPGRRQILLDNLDGGGSIVRAGPLHAGAHADQADLVALGAAAGFPVTLDLSGGAPDRIAVRDRFTGAEIASHPLALPASATSALRVAVDLGDVPQPAVRLVTPAPGTTDLPAYADNELAHGRAAAVLEIWWDGPQDAVPDGTGAAFTATFRQR
jgi:hypothetical protein